MLRSLFLAILGTVAVLSASATSVFFLRNTDASAIFYYWAVEAPTTQAFPRLLATLPLAPGGVHGVAPGERVRADLGAGRSLVGVFVPWETPVSYLSVLRGGYLLDSEIPAKGTVLVDRPSFERFNQGRGLRATLQAWGLELPQMVLGPNDSWSRVPVQREWGPSFVPEGSGKTAPWPGVRTLQAVEREGALWVRLTASGAEIPPGVLVSLALRRPGALLQIPLNGRDGTVWSWVDGQDAWPVGWRVVAPGSWQARIPWDRFPPSAREAWESSSAVWSLMVSDTMGSRTVDLGTTVLREWP